MAIDTLSIGGTSYVIEPKYASSAGYATTASNAVTATNAVVAGSAIQAATVLTNGITAGVAINHPLLFTTIIVDGAAAPRPVLTNKVNSLYFTPSTNVLTVPSLKADAIGVYEGMTIYSGYDLNLKAPSTATTAPGGLNFKNYSGTELGKLWLDNGVFKLRYGSTDTAKTIIHEGNINDYLPESLPGSTNETLQIITGADGGEEYTYDGTAGVQISDIYYAFNAGKVDHTLTINIGNENGNDYYIDYDGSSDVTIDSVAWAQVAGAVKSPLTVLTAAGTMTYDGSTAAHITSVSYGSSAGKANIANYASSASYANFSKYLHAATSSSKLYLLGHTTGASGGNLVYKNANVTIESNSVRATGGFYETSDARLKTITNDVEIDFERLKSIPKIQYIKKGETAPHIGTIAQDLQKVYPEFVETGDDGYLVVDYAKLSVIPLKAVDILYDEVNKLKNELKTVKEENQILKDRLDNIESIINK